MKVLIATIVDDRKRHTFNRVIDAIDNIIDHTDCICDYFVVAENSDKWCISTCEDRDIDFKSITIDPNLFKRTTSFSICGYDEFQLYKIAELRNVCVDKAIKDMYDYMFFIDGDNMLTEDSLEILMGANKKDISGWYFLKTVPFHSFQGDMGDIPFITDGTTFGCRLVHSDIFTKIKFESKNMRAEDDLYNVSVKSIGFQTWIHPEVYSDHIGGGYTDEARTYREAQLNK